LENKDARARYGILKGRVTIALTMAESSERSGANSLAAADIAIGSEYRSLKTEQ
jgi:hypothetical protein